jgi:hypothetical protein
MHLSMSVIRNPATSTCPLICNQSVILNPVIRNPNPVHARANFGRRTDTNFDAQGPSSATAV